jgi:RIO kinase 1
MRIPDSLAPLYDQGILDEVGRPLMSGKEAQVYLVVSGGTQCVAKVYKQAQHRSFRQRAEYTEGRNVRNSRDQRAIGKRSKHGRAQDEAAWRSTEVDMIHRLHAAGVRVPVPRHFIDGVLIMELIVDADGNPAPRLADLVFEPEAARAMYERLIQEVVRMLAAGVVHGDFSDFNILVGADGPVIIDFPQSVDSARNTNARKLLLRDVENMHRFLARFVPNARRLPYAEEMWELFQQNALTPGTRLQGRYRAAGRRANTDAVLDVIRDANHDERKRREALGLRGGLPSDSASAAPRQGQQQRRGGSPHHAQQQAPLRANEPRPGSPPNRPRPHDQARNEPSRDGPRPPPNHDSRSRARHNGTQPSRPHQHGRPPQHANAASPGPGPRGSGRPNGGGQRKESRLPEVFVLRRPSPPGDERPTMSSTASKPHAGNRQTVVDLKNEDTSNAKQPQEAVASPPSASRRRFANHKTSSTDHALPPLPGFSESPPKRQG